MRNTLVLFIFLYLPVLLCAQQQEVPYTLADRDRLIQVETKLEALDDKVDKVEMNLSARMDSLNARMDRMENKFDTYFTWGFGLVLGGIFALFGFIIWDRRTTIAPVKREQDKVIEALRELGKTNEQIREALQKVALW